MVAVSAVTVWGYYRQPSFAAILEPLAKWQGETGWSAAVVNRTVFCGLLPGAFLLTVRSIRPPHPWRTMLASSRFTCFRFPCRFSLSASPVASGRSSGSPLAFGSQSPSVSVE